MSSADHQQNEERIQATQTSVDTSLRETKSHGSEGFPMAVYLDDFTNFENGYICWHWHEEVQFTQIIEGDFICQVEKDEVRMKPGDAIFINAGRLHQIRPIRQSEGKLYSFIFKANLLGGNIGSDIFQKSVEPILRRNLPFIQFEKLEHSMRKIQQDKESIKELLDVKSVNSKISDTLIKIAQLYIQKEPHFQLKICCLLQQIWITMCEELPNTEESISAEKLRDDTRIKLALQYMQAHFGENLSLDEIAKEAMISRSELCRCFQRTLHMTPKEFLLQYRIRQATVLLQKPEMRILDVAEITGFNSPSHFGVYFHKYMGCSPKEYRKHLENE